MKTKRNLIVALFSGLLFSCSGEQSELETKQSRKKEILSEIEELNTKLKDLKEELAILNQDLNELDTIDHVATLNVTAISPKIQDFVHKIEVQANIETDLNALVVAESQGIIRKIVASEGQAVKKGQTLAIIDSEILQDNINEVKKAMELADFVYQKQKALHEKGIGSELDYESAKNQKESLEKKLITLQSQQGKTVIKAPITGVLDEIFLNLGEMASPQQPFARIVNADNVKAIAEISATHLANIKQGTEVELVIPSFNDTTLISELTNIGNYINPTNRTLKVQTEIKGNKFLIPNMVAIMKIVDFQMKNALTVDRRVIVQDRNNNYFIYLVDENAPEGKSNITKVEVEILSTYKDQSAIKVNRNDILLTESSKIVDQGAKGITENDRVIVKQNKEIAQTEK
ncbi:MAG: efflux RND transporter periplasmic adaptor subunit [Crocinitomicaceae bacterium]|nr:efflux RND transporter periplasmic adaptor subunit [Crocinitomicaceae bacterium]